MRLLQVNKHYAPWVGGVESVVQNIAAGLHNHYGTEVRVLACQPKGSRVIDWVEGIQVYRAASFGRLWSLPLSLDFFVLFRRLVKSHDALLLHHPFPSSLLAYALFGRKLPLYIWYHADITRQRSAAWLLEPLLRFVLGRSRVIFVSGQNIITHSRHLKKVSHKCAVIPLSVDIHHYAASPDSSAKALAIRLQFGQPLILAVGRLVYYKGFSYLIEAMQQLEAHLLIIGTGPFRQSLINQINHLGLSRNVKLVDPVSDLIPYYYAADVFVLPSISPAETFGIVQLEAMACGKPVINTQIPTTVPEVSVDGLTGLTVPAANSTELHHALARLIQDSELRLRFGQNARIRAATLYNRDKFIEAIRQKLA